MSRLLALCALATAPLSAYAVPITIDFSGAVDGYYVFDADGNVSNEVGTLSTLTVHGRVVYDRELGPAPVIFEVDGFLASNTQQATGTPLTEFVAGSLTWDQGVFVPAPIPVPEGAQEVGDSVTVENDYFLPESEDSLVVTDAFAYRLPDHSQHVVGLQLLFFDQFIAGEDVPLGDELPDFSTASGGGRIVSAFVRADTDGNNDNDVVNGFILPFTIDRAVRVPEPGALALFCSALMGLALLRAGGSRHGGV